MAVLTYYGEREELDRATASGSFSQDRSSWSRTLIIDCQGAMEQDLYDTIIDIVGTTETAVGDGRLTRLLPKADPQFRWMVADSIASLQGLGQSGEITLLGPEALEVPPVDDSYGLWGTYDCRVNFMPAPYALLSDDKITMTAATWYERGDSTARPFVFADEWLRFTLLDRLPKDEYVTGVQGKFRFYTGRAAVALAGTFSSAGTAVTGAGTAFTTEVKVGDLFGHGTFGFSAVSAIAGDTALTLAMPLPKGNAPAGTPAFISKAPDGQTAKGQVRQYLNNADVTLTWYGVPLRYVRSANCYFDKYRGRVNQNEWQTPWKIWKPGELLYQNYSYKEYVPAVATMELDPIFGTLRSTEKLCTVVLKFLETRRDTTDVYAPADRNVVVGGHNLLPWWVDRKFHFGGTPPPGGAAGDPVPGFDSVDLRILFTDPDFVQTPLAGGGKPI
jgi:hypothetical protein